MTKVAAQPAEFDSSTQKFLDDLLLREQVTLQADGIDAFRQSTSRLQQDATIGRIDLPYVDDISINGMSHAIPARVYSPRHAVAGSPLPVLVYLHGGAWVIGDLDSYDNVCRYLAASANCICVSVDYRLAPEHPFPAAVDDACAAVEWLLENAASLGGDPNNISIAGDSAGGTLAAAVCQHVTKNSSKKIRKQILIYPCLDRFTATHYPSRKSYGGGGYFLDSESLEYLAGLYLTRSEDHFSTRAWPALADDLSGQPATLMILADLDLLRDECLEYAQRLEQAGTQITVQRYEQTIHGFLAFAGAIEKGREALDAIAEFLSN